MVRRFRVIAAALAALLVLPAVALATNDPYRDQQWSLDRIRIDEAWTRTLGAGAVVAVIDTGVDLRHPDLRDRILRDRRGRVVGLDLVDGGVPTDRHGHGTLVAGVIAATANNGVGIAGVAPEASIMPIRALDDQGAGRGRDVDTAIRWAVDNGADVINLSLESVKRPNGSSAGPGAPTAAVRYAWERGVPVVAAAGNGGASASDYPADSPVVLVGAVDRRDRRAAFSDTGRTDALMAPGIDIVSTWCRPPQGGSCDGRTHTFGIAEGTSFAAPHVAGAIALLVASGIDATEAVARLRATAVDLGPDGPDPEHGHGRIDVAAAISSGGAVAAAVREEQRPEPEPAGATAVAAPAPTDPDPVPEPAPPVAEPVAAPAPDPVPSEAPGPPEDEILDDEPMPELVYDIDDLGADDLDVLAYEEPGEGLQQVVAPAPPVAVVLPARGGTTSTIVLQLFAAAMVGSSLAAWSSVARRLA